MVKKKKKQTALQTQILNVTHQNLPLKCPKKNPIHFPSTCQVGLWFPTGITPNRVVLGGFPHQKFQVSLIIENESCEIHECRRGMLNQTNTHRIIWPNQNKGTNMKGQ